jgi:hypothetical protein
MVKKNPASEEEGYKLRRSIFQLVSKQGEVQVHFLALSPVDQMLDEALTWDKI